MDPNAALEHLREQVQYHDDNCLDGGDLERFVWRFKELDEWISQGGFLPDDWDAR